MPAAALSSATTATGADSSSYGGGLDNPPNRMLGGAFVKRASTVYTSYPAAAGASPGSARDFAAGGQSQSGRVSGSTRKTDPNRGVNNKDASRHHQPPSSYSGSQILSPVTASIAARSNNDNRHLDMDSSASSHQRPHRGGAAAAPPLRSLMFDEDELTAARQPFSPQPSNFSQSGKLLRTPEASSLLSSASTLDPTAADFHHELKRHRMKGEGRRRSSAANYPMEDDEHLRMRVKAHINGTPMPPPASPPRRRGSSGSRQHRNSRRASAASKSSGVPQNSAAAAQQQQQYPLRTSTINTDTTRTNSSYGGEGGGGGYMDEDEGYYSEDTPSSEEDEGDSSSVISMSSTDREREFQREARIRQKRIERIEFEKQQRLEEHERKEKLRAQHRREMIGELPFGMYPGSQLMTPIDRRMLLQNQKNDDDDDDEDEDFQGDRTVGQYQQQHPFGDSQEGFLNSTGTGSNANSSIPTQKMSKKKKAAMAAEAALAKKKQQEEEGLNAQQYEAISVAQYALKEASRHAISLQDMLVEIHTQLEDQESERLRIQHRIETQIDEGVKMDSTVANRKLKHEDQLETLKSRITYLEQETMTDREEKLRLLKIIDMYVNGGPTPTLSDWSFHHYINTVGQISSNPQYSTDALTPAATAEHKAQFTANSASNAAVSFAKILGSLPETNRDLLEKQRMFDFANQVINNVIVQYRRSRVVSAERGVIAGAVAVGLNVKLVELLSHVSADDLVKL